MVVSQALAEALGIKKAEPACRISKEITQETIDSWTAMWVPFSEILT